MRGKGRLEQWRDIAGWEGLFQVSDAGRVRSLDRLIPYVDGRVRHHRGKIIKPGRHPDGYQHITLSAKGFRKENFVKVHHLVLTAFVGPRPDGMVGCHYDDNGENNALENLRWDTLTGNSKDITRHGRNVNAAKTSCIRNHPYDEANTSINAAGHRRCRTCDRERCRSRRNNTKEGVMTTNWQFCPWCSHRIYQHSQNGCEHVDVQQVSDLPLRTKRTPCDCKVNVHYFQRVGHG